MTKPMSPPLLTSFYTSALYPSDTNFKTRLSVPRGGRRRRNGDWARCLPRIGLSRPRHPQIGARLAVGMSAAATRSVEGGVQ
jgi:hypothetical protein